jgi:hypothetical protein
MLTETPPTLYHFCPDHMLGPILREGLTKGCIAWFENGAPRFRQGFQWLTRNPSREAQEWCNPIYSTLPYDRCANRLTVLIPPEHAVSLSRWSDCGPLIVPPDQLAVLDDFGTPEDHFVYRGKIPVKWISLFEKLGARWNGRRA